MTDWQIAAVVAIEAAAVAYIVWKLGLSSRRRKKPKGKPDVPVSRLSRGKSKPPRHEDHCG